MTTLWRRVYEERRRVLLPLLLAAAANVVVFAVVVLPLGRSVAAAETQAQNAALRLAQARQLERQARDAAASRERADRELQQFYTGVLPRSFAAAERTTRRWLQQAARDSGLDYRAANFSWEELRESELSRAFADVRLRGSYADIRRFLHAVEAAEEFLVVERVDLAQPSSAGGANAGILEISLLVSTFFVAEPVR
jgi:Tfp pilus assembly protein PilO